MKGQDIICGEIFRHRLSKEKLLVVDEIGGSRYEFRCRRENMELIDIFPSELEGLEVNDENPDLMLQEVYSCERERAARIAEDCDCADPCRCAEIARKIRSKNKNENPNQLP